MAASKSDGRKNEWGFAKRAKTEAEEFE